MQLKMKLLKETKNCYCFSWGEKEDKTLVTIYLKKSDVDEANIDATKGILVTIEGNK